jgi:hypothetical protein
MPIRATTGSTTAQPRPRGSTTGAMTCTGPLRDISRLLWLMTSSALPNEADCISIRVATEVPRSLASMKSFGSMPNPSDVCRSALETASRGSPPWAIDSAAPRTVCAKDIRSCLLMGMMWKTAGETEASTRRFRPGKCQNHGTSASGARRTTTHGARPIPWRRPTGRVSGRCSSPGAGGPPPAG